MAQPQERRKFPRVPILIEIYYQSDSPVIRSRLADLSEGGLFVDTLNPLPQGAEVKFRFVLPGKAIQEPIVGLAKVAWIQPAVGMGIEFVRFGGDALDRLRAFLSQNP
ncbi:MAG TPA: PilZ domain-containing protein [bacterium]